MSKTRFIADTVRTLPLILVCWLLGAASASAQILLTAETGGTGNQAVTVAANRVTPADFGSLANFWAQYGVGVTDRVDVFALYGNISVFGDTQHYVGVGSNVLLMRRQRHALDVSFASNLSLPITRRNQASTTLVTLALLASRPVTIGRVAFTPYGGFSALVPVGQRAAGVFTPVETTRTGVAGVAFPLQKTLSAYIEYDAGPGLRSGGIGLALSLPRLGQR